ncbi:hypothetical protein MJO28_011883 [Puccinia striiformis f. sp. tritici]|uniref:Uncharacterized protein n=1 Tax=Puccinia striiformis f. sp. tritici TaxID=168172 RepID=A0ACC0E3D5_9BASI|nr:hypothetical protein MJO28_011883 [Puccinia striiformis f. sp. tritici]KAI7947114.1 hypothetical protein MJO29_011641 [Puccinia striiformis f. sp. tritici]
MFLSIKIAVAVGLMIAGTDCNAEPLSPRGEGEYFGAKISWSLQASFHPGSTATNGPADNLTLHLLRAVVSLHTPLTLKSVHESDDKHLVQKFILGDPKLSAKTVVEVYATNPTGSTLAKRDSPPQSPVEERPLDLTPSSCTSQVCYSGSFRGPLKTDCDTIVAAQLYNSTGSLRAFPGNYVLVYSGTCVVVFQNPISKPEYTYTLDYNWAKLGTVILDIQKKCDKPDDQSIGGACKIDHYLKFNFKNVLISLQRYVAPAKAGSDS